MATSEVSLPIVSSHQHTRAYRLRRFAKSFFSHGAIILIGLFFFIPFLWMLSTALKTDRDVFRIPPTFIPRDNVMASLNGTQLPLYTVQVNGAPVKAGLQKIESGKGTFIPVDNPSTTFTAKMKDATPELEARLRFENFADAMSRATRPGLGVNFWVYFKNSLVIAFFSIIGTLASCTIVAYGFARIRFPMRDGIFIFVLGTMMLPFQVTMIPLYLLFQNVFHWGDSPLPLIVPAFFANAYDIFLLRQFFRTIPEEMCDAARVDGASEWQIFRQVVLPLSIPVLATVTVFTFLWAWNDFLGPLIYLTSPRQFTMALGLQDFQGQHSVAWNLLMAASMIFTVPIVIAFFFAQKTFIQGIKLTGLKE